MSKLRNLETISLANPTISNQNNKSNQIDSNIAIKLEVEKLRKEKIEFLQTISKQRERLEQKQVFIEQQEKAYQNQDHDLQMKLTTLEESKAIAVELNSHLEKLEKEKVELLQKVEKQKLSTQKLKVTNSQFVTFWISYYLVCWYFILLAYFMTSFVILFTYLIQGAK